MGKGIVSMSSARTPYTVKGVKFYYTPFTSYLQGFRLDSNLESEWKLGCCGGRGF